MNLSKSINYSIGFVVLIIFLTGLDFLGIPLIPKFIISMFMWVWEKGLIEGNKK